MRKIVWATVLFVFSMFAILNALEGVVPTETQNAVIDGPGPTLIKHFDIAVEADTDTTLASNLLVDIRIGPEQKHLV